MKKVLLLIAALVLVFTLTGCLPQEIICTFPDQEVAEEVPLEVDIQLSVEEINEVQGKLFAKETKARMLLEEYHTAVEDYLLTKDSCEVDLIDEDCLLVNIHIIVVNGAVDTFNEYIEKNADVWEYNTMPEDISIVLEKIVLEDWGIWN